VLDRAVGLHFDVRGLQITVDDAVVVRIFQCLGNLLGDWQS
jgi:hypothetical protein